MTTKLKTNWTICTTDEQFKTYILTLEALGYSIFESTKKAMLKHSNFMVDYDALKWSTGDVCRGHSWSTDGTVFSDISSFLIYHFSSEKTEAEKELEALQEKMNSLQEQIDRVKLSVSK